MSRILAIVKAKAKDIDAVPIEMVVDEAKAEGIEKDKVEEIISKLKKKGGLYEPKRGVLKPTDKK
jgi:DNA replicative helicase MCM subunit Mcm2 (Cdc46/Mcm family)